MTCITIGREPWNQKHYPFAVHRAVQNCTSVTDLSYLILINGIKWNATRWVEHRPGNAESFAKNSEPVQFCTVPVGTSRTIPSGIKESHGRPLSKKQGAPRNAREGSPEFASFRADVEFSTSILVEFLQTS